MGRKDASLRSGKVMVTASRDKGVTRVTVDISRQSYFPADTSQPVQELSTGQALRRSAYLEPDRLSLIEVVPKEQDSLTKAQRTDRRWTYSELLHDAEQCARWLLSRFTPGEHICVWAPNVPEWVVLQYGAALAGLVLVTANPALRQDELKYVLKQSKSVGLFHLETFRGVDMKAVTDGVREDVREVVCFTHWLEAVKDAPWIDLPNVGVRDPAQIQYTSGTTGQPKGALLHHMGLVTNAGLVARRLNLDKGVLVSPMPLFHTAGSVLSSLGAITTCSTLVLPVVFEPDSVLQAVQEYSANVMFGVPTMLIALLEQSRRGSYSLTSLRVFSSGGAAVPPELIRRAREGLGCELLAVYGQTEASPIISQTSLDDSDQDRAFTAGRPLAQVEVRIVDPGSNDVVAFGKEGEIQSRGYQTMLSYFEMPGATRDAITDDGWLRTGDLGTLDERGYLTVTGRLKDMIIRGGENIYPAEVEACLLKHPDVLNAAVFGHKDSHWGEVVCAAVQFRSADIHTSSEQLRAHCRAEIAPHKTPVRWFSCNDWPLTGSGKVQKFRLREAAEADRMQLLA